MGWFNHQLVESNDDGFSKLTWLSKTKHFRIESLNQTQLESYPNIYPQLSWISPKCAVGSDSDGFFCASGGAATAKGGG